MMFSGSRISPLQPSPYLHLVADRWKPDYSEKILSQSSVTTALASELGNIYMA